MQVVKIRKLMTQYSLEQSSIMGQDSSCFPELGKTIASGNNLAFTAKLNDRNNVVGQQ
jgi:hypothetical protein